MLKIKKIKIYNKMRFDISNKDNFKKLKLKSYKFKSKKYKLLNLIYVTNNEFVKLINNINYKIIIKNKENIIKNNKYNDNSNENWFGNMFENVVKKLYNLKHENKIKNKLLIKNPKYPIILKIDGYIENRDIELIEIKTPFKNNKINKKRVGKFTFDQIQSSLHISECFKCHVVKALIKICTLEQLKIKDEYDYEFHKSNEKLKEINQGIIIWYSKIKGRHNLKNYRNPDEIIIDTTDNILKKVNEMKSNIYLTFKVFDYAEITLTKNDNYWINKLNNNLPKVQLIIDEINKKYKKNIDDLIYSLHNNNNNNKSIKKNHE